MFSGNATETQDLQQYPEAIRKVFEYIKATDLESMKPGSYDIEGQDIYVEIKELQTAPVEALSAEAHDIYIDLHYLIQGAERVGYAQRNDSLAIKDDRRPDADLIFYEDPEEESFIDLAPGDFAAFLPSDLHRPCCEKDGCMDIKKAVFKVRNALLS